MNLPRHLPFDDCLSELRETNIPTIWKVVLLNKTIVNYSTPSHLQTDKWHQKRYPGSTISLWSENNKRHIEIEQNGVRIEYHQEL